LPRVYIDGRDWMQKEMDHFTDHEIKKLKSSGVVNKVKVR
jgi:hypothetical protein